MLNGLSISVSKYVPPGTIVMMTPERFTDILASQGIIASHAFIPTPQKENNMREEIDFLFGAPIGAKTATPSLAKKVYYVLKGSGRCPYFATNSLHFGLSATLPEAAQFPSVGSLLYALQRYMRDRTVQSGHASLVSDDFKVVKVEETPTPARRELVTTGDLSLLDKGPVVIQESGYQTIFVSPDNSWVSLAKARVFPNAQAALDYIGSDAPKTAFIKGPFRVLPIREVPGSVNVTETVLA